MGFLFLMNQAYINLYQSSSSICLGFFKYKVLFTVPHIGSVCLNFNWGIDIRLSEGRRWDIKLNTVFNYFFKLYVNTIHDFLDL